MPRERAISKISDFWMHARICSGMRPNGLQKFESLRAYKYECTSKLSPARALLELGLNITKPAQAHLKPLSQGQDQLEHLAKLCSDLVWLWISRLSYREELGDASGYGDFGRTRICGEEWLRPNMQMKIRNVILVRCKKWVRTSGRRKFHQWPNHFFF